MRLLCACSVKDVSCCILQEAPWCYQASAASSCGSAPVSQWWSSCFVSTTASVSLLGTPWMWSPLSCTQQTGGMFHSSYTSMILIISQIRRAKEIHRTIQVDSRLGDNGELEASQGGGERTKTGSRKQNITNKKIIFKIKQEVTHINIKNHGRWLFRGNVTGHQEVADSYKFEL